MGASPRARGSRLVRGRHVFANAAHPRGRGGADAPPIGRRVGPGASPRARGSRSAATCAAVLDGASPRARGSRSRAAGAVALGASPRARGSRTRRIPATPDAAHPRGRGGASTTTQSPACSTAHPRGRGGAACRGGYPSCQGRIPAGAGEPRCTGEPMSAVRGASPRARGSLRTSDRTEAAERRIPAGAGEPSWAVGAEGRAAAHPRGRGGADACASVRAMCAEAHPRGRGGADDRGAIATVLAGASPRARGSRGHQSRRGRSRDGRIPAGAGEPRSAAFAATTSRAHPRGRGGAASVVSSLIAVKPGASPRARGSLGHSSRARRAERRIPAGAGEPMHPHHRPAGRGASPRARGSRRDRRRVVLGRRRIPAGAGEPLWQNVTASEGYVVLFGIPSSVFSERLGKAKVGLLVRRELAPCEQEAIDVGDFGARDTQDPDGLSTWR